MQKLMDRPCPEQLSDQYKPEWPKMKELLAKAAEPKTCLQKISECVRAAVSFRSFYGPEEDGVLDHMVKVTTSLGSPFIALACRTVCPGSPPCVGKRRLAVQEILRKQRAEEIRCHDKDHISRYEKLFQNSKVTVIPKKKERRASLQPISIAVSQVNAVATRKASLLSGGAAPPEPPRERSAAGPYAELVRERHRGRGTAAARAGVLLPPRARLTGVTPETRSQAFLWGSRGGVFSC